MRSSLLLVALLCSGLIFTFWSGVSQYSQEEWSSIILSDDEVEAAIDQYKRNKYLREIGFYRQMFPFSAIWTSNEQYVWLLVERIDYILFGLICYFYRPPKKVVVFYLWIKGLDLIDHMIHYNEPYFISGPFHITYNVVSIAVFAAFVMVSRKHYIGSD